MAESTFLNLRLPTELKARLRMMADKRGVSVTELVLELINGSLAEERLKSIEQGVLTRPIIELLEAATCR